MKKIILLLILLSFLILYQILTSPNIDRILPIQFEVVLKKKQRDISFILKKNDERYRKIYNLLRNNNIKWYMNIASISIANITLYSDNMNILLGGSLDTQKEYSPIIIQYQPKHIGKGFIELRSNVYINWDIENDGDIQIVHPSELDLVEELKVLLVQILALLLLIISLFI